MRNSTFVQGLIIMIFVSAFAMVGYRRLLMNQAPYLQLVGNMISSGQTKLLDSGLSSSELSLFLVSHGYIDKVEDADAVASYLIDKIHSLKDGKLVNLGQINTVEFCIPANYIETKGETLLRSRLEKSKNNIGVTSLTASVCIDSLATGSYHDLETPSCKIIVCIHTDEELDISGVPVCIKRHYYTRDVDNPLGIVAADSIIAYIKTDRTGIATFHVKPGNYSVIPIEPGFEFGMSKGSTGGELKEGEHIYRFKKKEHSITPFSPEIYRALKKDDALVVRDSSYYQEQLKICMIVLLSIWWIAFIVAVITSLKVKARYDFIILPIIMFLNIMGVLILFGMNNPLTDRLLGMDMTIASVIGVLIMIILSFLPIGKIYASGFKVLGKRIPFEPLPKITKGLSYLLLSILLIVLLSIFGSAPEGSDAKINLFFLQPSELCKFLTVIFMAAFFAEKSDPLRKFTERTNRISFHLQLRTTSAVLTAIFILSLMYMCILSDMGPALIILVTFIFMYSFARRDFFQLLIGTISFVFIISLVAWRSPEVSSVLIAALIWLILWLSISLLWKKTIYESAVFLNLLILLFITGGSLLQTMGLHHQASRLLTRMAMYGAGVWDNGINPGGDQIAQALWGYSSGGLCGQGLGLGNSSLIPAGHTDMILASVGEQTGIIGVISVIACIMIILYRSYIDGKRSGNPFSFFLSAGIGSVIAVQFFIIALGSVGLIPLTGIAVPFLSYAKSSLVCNLAAIGILLAVSKENAGHYQRINMMSNRRTLAYGFLSCMFTAVIFLYTLIQYMVVYRNDTMLRCGIFTDSKGLRSFHYNPRIKVLEDKLDIAPIYDRNGLLLASSSKKTVEDSWNMITAAGISSEDLNLSIQGRLRRYYPFGKHTFFMLGDYNSKILWSSSINNPHGLNSENLFLAKLRGFNNLNLNVDGERILDKIEIPHYRPDKFLPALEQSFEHQEMKYDYTELLPLLKDGIQGRREIKEYSLETASAVHLTLDARLQTTLQNKMSYYCSNSDDLKELNKLRASVVILDGVRGDLLTSANYPLPELSLLDSLEKNSVYVYDEKNVHQPAYTDRDLGLTYQTQPGSTAKVITSLAGYRKLGDAVSAINYDIDLYEIIENGRVNEPYSSVGGKRFRNKISVTDAIVQSSNCYFINLLADKNLYSDLATIYEKVGVRLDGHENAGSMTPYYLYTSQIRGNEKYYKEMANLEALSLANYSSYKDSRKQGKWRKMNRYNGSADYWGIAYGQGELYASPLNMARIGSIVANNGFFTHTRYELDEPVITENIVPSGTALLEENMMKEADKHRRNGHRIPRNKNGVVFLSKTGTPERTWRYYDNDNALVEEKPNDGWYMFAIKNKNTAGILSIAVRLERLGSLGSRAAVKFAAEVVIPALKECGYDVN